MAFTRFTPCSTLAITPPGTWSAISVTAMNLTLCFRIALLEPFSSVSVICNIFQKNRAPRNHLFNAALASSRPFLAAASGRLGAFLMLAICYRDGAGVLKDIVMAHVFANISTGKLGKVGLVERLQIAKELGAILPPEQRAESDALQFGGMAELSRLPELQHYGSEVSVVVHM